MIRTDIIYFIFFQFTKNPLRTLLSISGIMIGIATLLMMTILSDGMQKQMLEKLTQSGGSNLIEVQPEYEYYGPPSGFDQKRVAKNPITVELIEKLNTELSNAVIPIQSIGGRLSISDKVSSWNMVVGTSPEYLNYSAKKIIAGRFLTDYDLINNKQVIVISEKLAEEYFRNKNVLGKYLTIKNLQMQIIGIVNTENELFIPITTALKKIKGKSEVDRIYVYANNFEDVDNEVEKLKLAFKEITGSERSFNIRVPSDRIEKMFEAKESFSRLLTIITIICLAVGGIGVMNTMLSSVNERIREIGILKSVGAKNREVLKQFISESLLICLIGGIIGIFLGIFAGEAAAGMLVQERYLKDIEAVVSLKSILIAVGFTTLVGIVFGIYPAIKAAKINPVDALRYE